MYEISSFIYPKISTYPVVAFPIYRSNLQNESLVAETDNYMKILEFQKFQYSEFYKSVPAISKLSSQVGDLSYFCIYDPPHEPIIGDLQYLMKNPELLPKRKSPFFDMTISKLLGETIEYQSDTRWRVAQAVFGDTEYAEVWHTHQNYYSEREREFWKILEYANRTEEEKLFGSIGVKDLDGALRWLSVRKNFTNSNWPKIWHKFFRLNRFDSMILQLGAEWVSIHDLSLKRLRSYKNIVYLGYIASITLYSELGNAESEAAALAIVRVILCEPAIVQPYLEPAHFNTYKHIAETGNQALIEKDRYIFWIDDIHMVKNGHPLGDSLFPESSFV